MLNDANAEVVVKKGVLNESAIMQIMDAVLSNTNIKAENVKISEA